MYRLWIVCWLAAAAACSGWSEGATVALEAEPLAPEQAREASVAALESGHHAIRVRRSIRVPDPCRTLAADLAGAGDALTLRIVERPSGDHCDAGEAYLAYTATIEGLRPGRYNLRVVHSHSGGPRSELVLEHPVLVVRPGEAGR